MKIHEHRIKILLNTEEFSQLFQYHSEGKLLGSPVDLETDLESYFEGVGVEDLSGCFGMAAGDLVEKLQLFSGPLVETELVFDLIVSH
ncbi:hypothetical protein [Roseibacillus persicicus]|uniref:Uncharacterized protein n=1 Tax=Roseibacillus persicicus TaxID=454148 RepID=A0A918TMU3_9BACT|nr:hypothetical protein [Roseibacillus persicicus]GHC56112.1 hypothetical protein GCM10007100_23760 [Roseibacillus persicicus]